LLTTLIGREREMALVQAFLIHSHTRLVTLTGPGGVGKTTLAMAAAYSLEPHFSDGFAVVPLASVRQAELVDQAIAQVLGVREIGNRSLIDRIAAYLKERELLLVLDNFEHVLEAGPLVIALLSACPGLTVLATSRSRLLLSGEQDVPVPPLALPPIDEPKSRVIERSRTGSGQKATQMSGVKAMRATLPRAEIEQSAAVELFVARARAVEPGFTLTSENSNTVAEVCRRVDGLPLAIELAAARVPILSPAALLQRLDRRLPLLTGGPRDLPARLRTMRDAIGWSYDLLTPDEQSLFRQLSIFVGGFTLEAAERVGEGEDGATSDTAPSVLDLMSSLRQEPPPTNDRALPCTTILDVRDDS